MTSVEPPGSALAEPTRPVRAPWVALLALANLGLMIGYYGPLQILLPSRVAEIAPGGDVVALGWITAAGAAVSLVVNPLAGALSDRTAGRFGRRRPWVLLGAVAGALALCLLSAQATVVGLLIGWCLAQGSLNALHAALYAAVPDRVPVGQRGAVSGWLGVPRALGIVVGVFVVTILVTDGTWGFVAVGALVLVCALPFTLTQPEPPLLREQRPPFRARAFLAGFWVDPRRHPDFGWAWTTRFLMQLGNAMATLYLLYFLRDAVGHPEPDTGLLVLILVYTCAVIATTVVGGMVSDRIGRRRGLVCVAGVVMAVPGVVLAFVPDWTAAIASAVVLGLGYGVYLSVDHALVTQVLPSASGRAKDLGIINIADSAPQVLGPALAAPLVAYLGGYTTLYLTVAAVTVLGAVLVWRIKSVP
ncbi:MFS transporter [Allonocardiopsis opalescens]|uniref:MFS transporter n=1 Tax=Allonocardiopsis opalescens TaxID=1144618 RepID=A0A2T0QDJ1_9ACTN|nr:MFS transporter [Allonocardiopsis opalescens]PRY01940.1 MFS transporter [Allonocardiopsis opalescens]